MDFCKVRVRSSILLVSINMNKISREEARKLFTKENFNKQYRFKVMPDGPEQVGWLHYISIYTYEFWGIRLTTLKTEQRHLNNMTPHEALFIDEENKQWLEYEELGL